MAGFRLLSRGWVGFWGIFYAVRPRLLEMGRRWAWGRGVFMSRNPASRPGFKRGETWLLRLL